MNSLLANECRGRFIAPTADLSAPENPSMGRISSMIGRIGDGCEEADKSAESCLGDRQESLGGSHTRHGEPAPTLS